MRFFAPVDNAPQTTLVKTMCLAEGCQVDAFNGRSIGSNNLKWFLFSFGHSLLIFFTHMLASIRVVLSCPSIRFSKPSFSSAIFHVIGLRSKKKMFGIYAKFIVAFVANKKSFVESAVSYFIGKPVGGKTAFVAKREDTISGRHLRAMPKPTISTFGELTVKPVNYMLCNHVYINTTNKEESQL
jgi:hypothetical protein